MEEQIDLACNCLPNLFHSQERLFLMRKKIPNEPLLPPSRRGHNSTEFKYESEGKPLKKSLKKRPLSNFSGEASNNQPIANDRTPQEQEHRPHVDRQELNRADFSFARMEPAGGNSARIGYNYPGTTRNTDPNGKNRSYNLFQQTGHLPQQVIELPKPNQSHHLPVPHARGTNPTGYRNAEPNSPANTVHHIGYSHRPHPSNYLNHPQQTRQDLQHVQKIHFPISNYPQDTDSIISNCNESVLIEQFDRFFNREEHESLIHLEGKSYIKPRESKKSKRGDKPQLVGRFAQSDNESYSQSTPSQVIGKGFASHFTDFWDFDQASHAKQTLASRTTNTKLSQLQKGAQLEQHHTRPKFGNIHTFKSYKNL